MQQESESRVRDMLARTGHVLVVADFDDLSELDRLAAEITNPQSGIDSPLNQHPVFIGGIPVYPLTLAHLTFLDEAAKLDVYEDDERVIAMLWVTTLKAIDDSLYNPAVCRRELRRFARSCRWTEHDVAHVMELRYGRIAARAQQADSKKGEGGDGALIGLLAREYGESPDYWMRQAPIGVIEACIADWNAQKEAQAAAYRKSARGKGNPVPPAPSPKIVALRKFRECAERIEAKWRSAA